LIPITRKEHYLNRIVGNKDYPIPEKPITTEEFFFAEILGEAVQAPEPLTRYQMYLVKIAGRNIEIPTPITRLEHFLARAAGVDITVPVPITREEMFWADYALIELNGIPPLMFKSDGAELKSYRIYGATGGVGDYDENSGKYVIPVTIAGKNEFDGTLFSGYYTDSTMTSIGGVSGNYKSCKVYLSAGTYTFSCSVSVLIIRYITSDIYRSNPIGSKYTQEYTFTLANDSYVSLAFRNESNTAWDDSTTIQVELSQSATEYEPFHEPSTINIFLDEPVYEGESVSMADTSIQIGTIDGTNILTVGTAVQPSGVEIKGRIQEVTP
jgi:hypothetical protein